MKARNRIALLPAIGAALAFIPKGFSKAWVALLIWPAATLIYAYATDGAAVEAKGLGALFLIVILAISRLMAVGALFRAALGKTADLGFGGLQFRGTEFRIIAAGLLVGLIAGLLSLVVAIPIALVAQFFGVHFLEFAKLSNAAMRDWRVLGSAAVLPNGPALVAVAVVQLIAVYALVARLSLWLPATVKEGRIVVTDSLGLTRGATLTMMAGYLLLVAGPAQILKIAADDYVLDAARISNWVHMDLDSAKLNLAVLLVSEGVLAPILSAGFLAAAYRAATKPSALVSEALAATAAEAAPAPSPVA